MPARTRAMTVKEAVLHLGGMSEATLKKWLKDAYQMKAKPCPFGDAVLSVKGEWQYYIHPERLHAYMNAKDLILTAAVEPITDIRVQVS